MARTKRADEAGAIYHMLNRANRRDTILHKEADFEAFERVVAEALQRVRLKLFAYFVLSNHSHLVVSPEVDGEVSRFGQFEELRWGQALLSVLVRFYWQNCGLTIAN